MTSHFHGKQHYQCTSIVGIMLAPNNCAVLSLLNRAVCEEHGYYDIEARFHKHCAIVDGKEFVLVALQDAVGTLLLFDAATLPTSEVWNKHQIAKCNAIEYKNKIVLPSTRSTHMSATQVDAHSAEPLIRYMMRDA